MKIEVNEESLAKALESHKWLKIDEARYDLLLAAKTAELATNAIMDDGDAYDLYGVMELLLQAVKRACESLQESIVEWQSREPYLDDGEGVSDAES